MHSPFSVYVHIPFCLHKCPYCDFNTYALTNFPEFDYTNSLLAELDFYANQSTWAGRSVQSIFFGGGTPSLLSSRTIAKIINAIAQSFPVEDSVEISIEANPGNIDADYMLALLRAGVNRLSLGAQSLNPESLHKLGRLHTPEDVNIAVQSAHSAGFRNVNLDLLYGSPDQSLEMLKADLRGYIALKPEHISAYGLTVEKGTPFFFKQQRGQLPLPDEDSLLEMMEEVSNFLSWCGFEHYEISNFCMPGKGARHNIAYWTGADYLGLGAGAHSFTAQYGDQQRLSATRWSNYALPNKYMGSATAFGKAQSWQEVLSPQELWFEFFFLGLRMLRGVNLPEFERLFGIDSNLIYGPVIQILCDEGLLLCEDGNLRLSKKGIPLADSVIENFAQNGTQPLTLKAVGQ